MLNQTLQFKDLPQQDKNAFAGVGVQTFLHAGTLLFRFALTDSNSPWWSEVKDLPAILADAKLSNQDFAEYIRKRTAVFKHWNLQSNLMIAKLTTGVYGFKGVIAPQQTGKRTINTDGKPIIGKSYTKPIFLGGGLNQVLIKNITDKYYQIVLPGGAIKISDPIDDITDVLVSFNLI